MITADSIRRWCWIHKWTSLVCTVFLLLLCVTGLPLIFHHELEEITGHTPRGPELPANTPPASLDRIVAAAQSAHPGLVPHILFQEPDEPTRIFVGLGKTPEASTADDEPVFVDTRTAEVLSKEKHEDGIMEWIYHLHVDLFAGIPGKLFLGFMALLFLLAIVSGVVLYAPFMRERSYGVVRRTRGSRLKWLDLHNLLGASVAVWMLVVGGTGMINTWADLLLKLWQNTELKSMVAAYEGQPPATKLHSLEDSLQAALKAEPDMKFYFVAYPGTIYSSKHHYAVFMRGDTPLTSRLFKPVLIDAQTGQVTDKRDMPWYITGLLISQPLHFGDYGGLPLKILWAVFDIVTIIVLLSGVYLWWLKRKTPVEIDLNPASVAKSEPAYS